MATAIKAIPTLRGREARSFARRADRIERSLARSSANRDDHPFCRMARFILGRSAVGK